MTSLTLIFAVSLAAVSPGEGGSSAGFDFTARVEAAAEKLPRSLARFVDYPPSKGTLGFPRCLFENPFPPNPDFWLRGVDFSCASPWNDSCGTLRAGTAISRRHIVFAKHYPLWPGVRMAFVGDAGETSHYTIKATKALEGCDIMLGLLDYELTPDVHPAKILPIDLEKFLPDGSSWPVVSFNQREDAFLSELVCRQDVRTKRMTISNRRPEDRRWKKLGGDLVTGDSGNPAFLLYGGRPILLCSLYSGGVGHGPLIHEYRHAVQRAMDELCPGYLLEPFK